MGTDRRDESEARDTRGEGVRGECLRTLLVHGLERAAAVDVGGDRIDDGIRAGERARDRSLVAHIGAEHRHPLEARCMQGNTRTLGIAGYDADGHSFGGETAHETLAENPGAPEYTHRHHPTGPVLQLSRMVP